jgi:F-type H+-transporting ATPase subunit b
VLLEGSIFLLPNGTFFVELILFIIVLGIIAKFILPPIQATLAERERIVRSSVQSGEESRAEADRLTAERELVLERARAEARARYDEAARVNEERRVEARARGEAERARLVAEAASRLEAERQEARAAAMAGIDQLVIAAAARVLGRPVDPARHRAILEDVTAEVAAPGGR